MMDLGGPSFDFGIWYTRRMWRKFVLAVGVFTFLLISGSSFLVYGAGAQELTPSERAELERQYAELQKEIAAQQEIIRQTQAKKNTLQGDVTLLNAQIRAAQA